MQNSSEKILNDFEEEQEHIQANLSRKISEYSELHDLHMRYTYSNASNMSSYSQNGLYEQTSTVEQEEAKFIKDDELYEQILQKINDVKKMLYIEDNDLVLYIYQQYQWNSEKLVDFFTDDWEQFRNRMQSYEPKIVGQVKEEGLCQICCEQTQIYSSGMCEHMYCKTCWEGYISSQLSSGNIFFGCMHEKPCRQAPVLQIFVKTLLPDLAWLYRRKICVNYSIQNRDLCYCPQQKCPYFCIKPILMELQLVKCPCGELYCFRCQQQPHAPATCHDVQRWNELLNSQNINLTWIKNNTRECPKCKQPIEKKVGCSHMKCICQCQFCYECNTCWDEEHQMAKSECPKRKSLKRQRKLSDKLMTLAEELSVLMREKDRHEGILNVCSSLVKEQAIQSKVVEVKVEVVCAWMTLKWAKIMLAMENAPPIEKEVEKDFIQSIRNTMEPVQHIKNNIHILGMRDIRHDWQTVQCRKEILKKNKNVWIEAFEVHSPTAKCLSFSI